MKTISEKKYTLGSILPCKSNRWPALIALCASLLSLPADGNTLIWNGGGGADANWNNSANWFGVGTPNNGDTLIFQGAAGLNTTNNIASLTVNQIQFRNGGFAVYGTAFTLTNSILCTNSFGTNTIFANLTLATDDVQLVVSNGTSVSLIMNNSMNGSVGIVKGGTGNLYYRATGSGNGYTGTTLIRSGLFNFYSGPANASFGGPLVIGDGSGAPATAQVGIASDEIPDNASVTVNLGGTLDVNGYSETIGPLTMSGGTVKTGTGTLTLNGNLTTLASGTSATITGNLAFTGGMRTITVADGGAFYDLNCLANIYDNGNGLLFTNSPAGASWARLTGSNTISGPIIANNLTLDEESSYSLGVTNPVTIGGNGTLWLWSSDYTNKSLTLQAGANLTSQNNNSWAGPIVLTGNVSMYGFAGAGTLNLAGPITGTGNISETADSSVWVLLFSGSTANTYDGTTTVTAGTLLLSKSAGIAAVPGNLVINNGATARLGSSQQTVNSADVLVNGGGLFDFSTFNSYMDTLHGTGTVNFGVNGWIYIGLNNGSSEFDGSFTGTGYSTGWTVGKTGSGTFIMGGNSSYTAGVTHVYSGGGAGGKLVINGSQPQIPVIVDVGTTLGGSGTVSTITADGVIAPGNSPGILNSSNVTFSSTGNFTVELTGPNPGVGGYDQLNVTGTATLANATLTVVPAFTTPVAVGQQFVIINNDAADAVTGTFNGLPGGATISAGGYKFTISYVGGTGNDVVLTLADVPAATLGSLSTVAAGNGDGMIAPNECNNLGIVITNKTATPMTGVSATLASTTPGVIVTESAEPYPNIAGNGTGTNSAPFLITTTPNFVCGTVINLTLTVTTASHGSFVVPVVVPTGGPSLASVRFDNNNITNVPDIGTIESTNTVASWSGGSITKVVVSLWLVAPFSSDMSLSLIAPDGTTVPLASGVGAGANFGSGSADGNRTTFDDAAATAITAGSSPFVGTFSPQSPLSAFIGTSPVGAWRLHIVDSFGSGSPDTLRAWSLFLNGTDCGTGSGICELCPNVTLTSALGSSSPTQVGYLASSGISVCGVPKACPGTYPDPSIYPTENFTFRNGPSDTCISVTLSNISIGGGMAVGAYLGSFNPANPDKCTNYLGDPGLYPAPGTSATFSFNVASNATFVINVLGASYGSYKLTVTGGDCSPALNITDVGAGKAKLDWTTAAAGYQLESTNTLASGSSIWSVITNPAVVIGGRFQVTNTVPSANQFYHLRKP